MRNLKRMVVTSAFVAGTVTLPACSSKPVSQKISKPKVESIQGSAPKRISNFEWQLKGKEGNRYLAKVEKISWAIPVKEWCRFVFDGDQCKVKIAQGEGVYVRVYNAYADVPAVFTRKLDANAVLLDYCEGARGSHVTAKQVQSECTLKKVHIPYGEKVVVGQKYDLELSAAPAPEAGNILLVIKGSRKRE